MMLTTLQGSLEVEKPHVQDLVIVVHDEILVA